MQEAALQDYLKSSDGHLKLNGLALVAIGGFPENEKNQRTNKKNRVFVVSQLISCFFVSWFMVLSCWWYCGCRVTAVNGPSAISASA